MFTPREKLVENDVKACWFSRGKSKDSLIQFGESGIRVDRRWHYFDDVVPTQKVTTDFHVTNLNATPVRIPKILTSCGCTTVNKSEGGIEIAPGETEPIEVEMVIGDK